MTLAMFQSQAFSMFFSISSVLQAIEIKNDEIPLFWPCGVTPQNVITSMKLPFAITHAPGHMFVTDKKDSEYYE